MVIDIHDVDTFAERPSFVSVISIQLFFTGQCTSY